MKYAYTILYVEHVAKTAEFYSSAFGFITKFITDEQDYAELESGGATIAFASVELAKSNIGDSFEVVTMTNKPPGIELAFTTKDIQKDFKTAIDAGCAVVSDIKQKPWGQQVAYLRDLNGFLIELCTPMNS